MPVPMPVPMPGQPDGRPRQRVPLLTRPAAAVLLAHVSAMLQQHPGALEVAQRGGQVQRGASSGVQLLNVGLPGGCGLRDTGGWTLPPTPSCRHKAARRSSQTFAGISESVPIPVLSHEMHMHCTPKSSPRSPQLLPAPRGGRGECGGAASARHSSARSGWAAPTTHTSTEQGQWGPWMPSVQLMEFCTAQCSCKLGKPPPPLGFEVGGLLPSCQAAAAGSPPCARAGSAAGADVGCGGRTCSPA